MDTRLTNPAVQELATLFAHIVREEGFGADHWHSLAWNLHNVREEEWARPAPGGERTIREIVIHVGHVIAQYDNAAFGDGQRAWGDDSINGVTPGETIEDGLAFVEAGHALFLAHLLALSDADLTEPRSLPWCEQVPTRRIVELLIQHTLYHTGEINHLRALLQGNDSWDYQDLGREDLPE